MNYSPLCVLMGPARSGRRESLVEDYLRSLDQEQRSGRLGKCLWLAPSRLSVDDVRTELIDHHGRSILAPGIYTFDSFADAVIVASNREARPITTIQQKYLLQLVVENAIANEQLAHFGPVADTPGFLVQLGGWISDKKRKDEWAEEFAKNTRSRRDQELALLYGAYQRLLAVGKLYDGEGRFWAARDILETNPASHDRFTHVVVYGFGDFTVAQLDILRLLSERCEKMQISLTADGETSDDDTGVGRGMLFSRSKKTYEQLLRVLPKLTKEHTTSAQPSQSVWQNWKPSFRHAEQQLFGEVECKAAPTGIEIVGAAGQRQELEWVAAKIKEKLYSGEAQPEEIAIVARNLGSLAPKIADVLENHGIPHWLETRPRLSGGALSRVLQGLLRLKLEDWPFRLILELTGNRTISIFNQPAEMRPRDCLEEAIRNAQIPSGSKRLIDQLERWSKPASQEKADPAKRVAVARDLLQMLAARLDELPRSAEIERWAEHLETLLTELGVLDDPRLTLQWKILASELAALHLTQRWACQQNQSIDLRQSARLIRLIADQTPVPASGNAVGRVRVLTTESARHLTVPHLYLIDCNEQAFSSGHPVGQLDATGQRSAEEVLSDQGEMMYLFYTLISRATESLTISYPALDEKGQPLTPSPMLDELKKCFQPQEIPTVLQSPGLQVSEPTDCWSRSARRIQSVREAQRDSPELLAGLVNESSATGRTILAGINAIASRSQWEDFGKYEGLLTSPAAQADLARRFDSEHLWSPSQLEGYANCPFRFFSSHLLALSPPKDIAVANDLGRRGSILHQVLAEVHQKLSSQALEVDDDEPTREALAERFRQVLSEEVAAHPLSGLDESLREIERREIEGWAIQYADQEIQYRQKWQEIDRPPRPTYFEVRFGPEVRGSADETASPLSTKIPFELDLGNQQIRITGQIDRIDVGRIGNLTVFNVIDYKSGNKEISFKPEHLAAGKQVQLPLYALAAEELLLSGEKAQALAAGYWSIQNKGFEKGAIHLKSPDGNGLQPSEEWGQLRQQLVETLGNLVEGVQSGHFPVFNSDENCTRGCPYRTICRVGQIRALEKQWPPEQEQRP